MIERKKYLDLLIDFKDKDLIKVVTGIRRCGKSTLFDLYCDYLKEQGLYETILTNMKGLVSKQFNISKNPEDTFLKGIKSSNKIKCPVLLMGSHSVMPSTIP